MVGKVFVGLSGGVDSSVSAALLKNDGYEVVGVFMKTWHPDFLPCMWKEERQDAMRVAAHLDIPFLTFDLEDAYKHGVADYMIREYKAGRTPNPDVMCNKEVKFGAFLERSLALGADCIATGHYARVRRQAGTKKGPTLKRSGAKQSDGGRLVLVEYADLLVGVDEEKDQSYFLWTLGQKQLSHTLFPVGGMKKSAVRELARKFGLPTAEKKDSQGVCFVGDLDMKEFLNQFIPQKKGNVLNTKGEIVGIHSGALFYTLGERHGFTITKKTSSEVRYYVVAKDVKKNTITVAHEEYMLEIGGKKQITLNSTNWISTLPIPNHAYTAQIRYHGAYLPCVVVEKFNGDVELVFETPQLVASGQSVVLYAGEVCMGGGVAR